MSEFQRIAKEIGLNDEQISALFDDAMGLVMEQIARFGGIVCDQWARPWQDNMLNVMRCAGNRRIEDISQGRDDIHEVIYRADGANTMKELADALAMEIGSRPEIRVIINPIMAAVANA